METRESSEIFSDRFIDISKVERNGYLNSTLLGSTEEDREMSINVHIEGGIVAGGVEEAIRSLEDYDNGDKLVDEALVVLYYIKENDAYKSALEFTGTFKRINNYLSQMKTNGDTNVEEIANTILFIAGISYYNKRDHYKAKEFLEAYSMKEHNEKIDIGFYMGNSKQNENGGNYYLNFNYSRNIAMESLLDCYLQLYDYESAYSTVINNVQIFKDYSMLKSDKKFELLIREIKESIGKTNEEVAKETRLIISQSERESMTEVEIEERRLIEVEKAIEETKVRNVNYYNKILKSLIYGEKYDEALLLLRVLYELNMINRETMSVGKLLDYNNKIIELEEKIADLNQDAAELERIKKKRERYSVFENFLIERTIFGKLYTRIDEIGEEVSKNEEHRRKDDRENKDLINKRFDQLNSSINKIDNNTQTLISITTSTESTVESINRFNYYISERIKGMLMELDKNQRLSLYNQRLIIGDIKEVREVLEDSINKLGKDVEYDINNLATRVKVNADDYLNMINTLRNDIHKNMDRITDELKEEIEFSYNLSSEDFEQIKFGQESILSKLLERFNEVNEEIKQLSLRLEVVEDMNESIKELKASASEYGERQDEIFNKMGELLEVKSKTLLENTDENTYEYIDKYYKEKFTDKTWRMLSNNEQRILITSRIIYKDFDKRVDKDKLDYSPVIIGLTKALESVLTRYHISKMPNFVDLGEGKFYTLKEIIESFPSFKLEIDGKKKYVNQWMDDKKDFNKLANRPLRDYIIIFKKDYEESKYFTVYRNELFSNNQRNGLSFKKFAKEMVFGLEYVRRNHRNKAAHKELLDHTIAEDCYNKLIEIEKLFKLFLDNVRENSPA